MKLYDLNRECRKDISKYKGLNEISLETTVELQFSQGARTWSQVLQQRAHCPQLQILPPEPSSFPGSSAKLQNDPYFKDTWGHFMLSQAPIYIIFI